MKAFILLSFLFASSSTFAETLHIGRFASMSSKEDESKLEVQSAKATAWSSTTGISLKRSGCNNGVVDTDQPGPYGKDYKSIDLEKSLSTTTGSTQVNIEKAYENLMALKKDLKKQVPFYCQTESVIGVELEVKILSTGRKARSVLTLHPVNGTLYVETMTGLQPIDSEVTIVETM